MIEMISRRLLSAMGQKHLIPFVNGLIHIGRPSEVKFPKELMGQGASILLSGLNNTMAFQSNPDWVWPWWYERQRNPAGEEFVPTGMNLITSNITSRNWISLGVQGSPVEAMLDPVGMLTPSAYAWSCFPYLRCKDRLYLPTQLPASQVEQRLEGGEDLCISTHYHVDVRFTWSSQTEAIRIGDEELVLFTHKLTSYTNKAISLTLGISLRPYNPLSVAHIHKIKFHGSLWRINHQAALWMLDEPQRVLASDRNGADPIFLCAEGQSRFSKSSKSGIAAGVAEYDLHLQPREEQIITTVLAVRKRSREPLARFHRPTLEEINIARKNNRKSLAQDASKGLQLSIPDERWMRGFAAVRKRLYVFDDGTHFSPGTYLYHHFWIRDNAFLFLAHMELGLTERLQNKHAILQKVQQRDGYFKSQEGEWDSNGQAMFTLMNAVIATGSMELVASVWPHMRNGARWIERMLQKSRASKAPHRGLMPAGFSAEHFGPNDHYYWDNFWSLQGLQDALWMAEMVGTSAEQDWLRDLIAEFSADLEENIRLSFVRTQGAGLPSSPYRKVDSSAIGNLVAIAPLNLVRLDSTWIKPTLEFLWNECAIQGMFHQKIVHTGLNAYLSIQLARGFLAVQDPRWHFLLQSVLDHASSLWTWPEAIHPRTGGGCMGDGDHGWAAAEFLSFTISVLVLVQQETLLLGAGMPIEWYTSEMEIFVTGAVTRFGIVSWRLHGQGSSVLLTWNVVRNRAQRKVPIIFALPFTLGLAHPRLSDFDQGRKSLLLEQDQGSFEIALPETVYIATK